MLGETTAFPVTRLPLTFSRSSSQRGVLPVCLADPMIGLNGIFLVHVFFTVGPACSGIDVRFLENTQMEINSGCTNDI